MKGTIEDCGFKFDKNGSVTSNLIKLQSSCSQVLQKKLLFKIVIVAKSTGKWFENSFFAVHFLTIASKK